MKRDWKSYAQNLPDKPGVYLFLDAQKKPVYVGKAKSLQKRVQSYFQAQNSDYRHFIQRLPQVLEDIETHVTRSEKEALILERELIRRHAPRFNVLWRDDKQYLCLRMDMNHEFPWVQVVRDMKKDGAHYFGPYHSAGAARKTLKVINRHFQLRTCSDAELQRRDRPCLEYQIGRCPAPCVFEIDGEAYRESAKDALLFLEGNEPKLVKRLEAKMWEASESFEYESAAKLRDQIKAIQKTLQKQSAALASMRNQDIIGMYQEGSHHCMAIMEAREGRVRMIRNHYVRGNALESAEVLQSFLLQYYLSLAPDAVPEEVVLSSQLRDMSQVAELISEHRGRKVKLQYPRKGERIKLLQLAFDNAKHSFTEKRKKEDSQQATLEALKRRLHLKALPRRIECFDISHFQGDQIVASKISFLNGAPEKNAYRRYKIKNQQGQDDFAAMYEVLSRRLIRGQKEEDLPDLIVIDGGKGQLASAKAALRDLELESNALSMIGLAKARTNARGPSKPERIFLAGAKEPIVMSVNLPEMRLLMAVRDEAHRFAVLFHTQLRIKKTLKSDLDAIEGIGPKRRRALLTAFGSVEGVARAELSELQAVGGLGQAQAMRVYLYYR